jgi:GNAT superfamily N-acetyltransferase
MTSPLEFRPALASDYDAFAALFRELKVPGEPAPRDLWERDELPTTYFVTAANAPIAYGYLRFYEDEAHVANIVTAPTWQGRGVGKFLMQSVARELRARGLTHWRLNVKVDNAPALRLYRAVGMEPFLETTTFKLLWADVARLPEPTPGLRVREPPPEEHAALQRRWKFPSGYLDSVARNPQMQHRVLTTGGDTVTGYARWWSFQRALALHLENPTDARALVEALRPYSEGVDHFLVGAEGQPELARVLEAAGGVVALRMFLMRGVVPR